jgi:acetyl esterase/lipase
MGRIISIPVDQLAKRAINKRPEIPLYIGAIPGAIPGPDEEEHTYDPAVDSLINKVSRPTLTVYLPPAGGVNRKTVINCPGGGYHTLLIDREGRRIAEAFNKAGIAAFVLKYRLPSDKTMRDKSSGPLQDLQQAIMLVRGNAAKWHLDPHDIGVMGFSAGGHLAATAGTHFDQPLVGNPSGISLRPDFMILIYPVISMTDSIGHIGSRNYLLGPAPAAEKILQYSNEFHVTRATPPAFITHAADDQVVAPANSLEFHSALMHAGVPSELQMYARGGHGYLHEPAFEEWFGRCLHWLQVKAP